MRQACINFQKKIKNYFAYQARQNYLRQQMSVYGELDAVKLREQQALAREQQVVAKLDAVSTERDALALRVSLRSFASIQIERQRVKLRSNF
jgi:hypothetical protein